MTFKNNITIGLAQISPAWLNREETLKKIVNWIGKAADQHCDLVVFGEALLPGYPFWVELINSPEFNSPVQKELFAHYVKNSIQIENRDIEKVCRTAESRQISVYLGIIERPADRGGHSLYCSLVYIDKSGKIQSVHRKLMPTYEERLVWSIGDGHGLRVHSLEKFTAGGLNCWENWMPLPRAALHGMGEDLHVAVWPGSARNTRDITRFIARESRSFVVSVSAVMAKKDIGDYIPHAGLIRENCPDWLADGGSCIAGPDGEWVVEPQIGKEQLIVAKIDHDRVLEERQNFDPSGHYSRPDVLSIHLNTARQKAILTINPD